MKKILIIVSSVTFIALAISFLFVLSNTSNNVRITFDSDGGTIISEQIVEKGSKVIKPTDPTKDDYSFIGWFLDNEEWSFIGYVATDDMTLTAKWELSTFSITYFLYDGINSDNNPTRFDENTQLSFESPTKAGYKFEGWYTNSDYSNGITELNGNTQSIELHAKWSIITYTIEYVLDDGINAEENLLNYTIETKYTLETPTKNYYTFIGWYTDSDYTNEIKNLYQNTGDLTLYAKWEMVTYNINYVLNGGDQLMDIISTYKISDGTIMLNNPTTEGYEFGYWYLDEELTNQVNYLTEDIVVGDSFNIVLYAGYTHISNIFQDVDHSGNTFSYLYFGKYPQTVELNETIIAELDKLNSTNEYGYYEYGGNAYAKFTTNFYSSNDTWSNGVKAVNNKPYYFKVENIKWRVIQNDGTIQVLSEYVLNQSQYYLSTSDRVINGETIHANNYMYSDLRNFLNDNFLNKAFTTSQQELIKTSVVDNSTYTTNDKIYALNYSEISNAEYGFSSSNTSTRKAAPTDFALANYVITTDGFSNWWSRTPNINSAMGTFAIYSITYTGSFHSNYGATNYFGVRPAFTLN